MCIHATAPTFHNLKLHSIEIPVKSTPPINQPMASHTTVICVSELELSETIPIAVGFIANSNLSPAI